MADLPDDPARPTARWQRSHRDYTPEVEMLTALFDRIGELILVTAASRGARGKPPSPGPRPAYAFEKARRQLTRQRHQQLAGRLLRKNQDPAET